MEWNWQQKDWPNFSYKNKMLEEFEAQFLHQSGLLFGAYQHINDQDKELLMVDMISDEALKTSEIEGEYLNRDSLQSSIRRNFGLSTDSRKIPAAEQGVAEMMTDLYRSFSQPLSHQMLFEWHKMLTNSRRDLRDMGAYRSHQEPMQVVSGPIYNPNVHFEAPPSGEIRREMGQFIAWFNKTAPNGEAPLPALARTGIAHLYFVCIHPFEDGNGRIGRVIAEKALLQSFGQPMLIALSHTIQNHKKDYYRMLEQSNKFNEISEWLVYFAKTILAAQNYTQKMIFFLIEKTKLYDRMRGQLNARQDKVIARVFREGIEGFKGGLSAENYISIAKTSRATATRDLQDLVDKGALVRKGALKSTRYYLNVKA